MKFFFDANLPPRVARALAQLERDSEIVCLGDRPDLPGDTQDNALLSLLEKEGKWIVVTRDRGKKDGDWHVWMATGLTVFFLTKAWGGMEGREISWRLLKFWDRIEQTASESPSGTKFSVGKDGTILRVRSKRRRSRKS